MGEITPIVAGAKYRDVSHGETHGDVVRVKSVWVDEDGETQVQVFTQNDGYRSSTRTVDLDSFIESIDHMIIRVNTDHEAWEWRN